MPELPDVEVFRRYLEEHSRDRRIENVAVKEDKILRGTSSARLKRRLKGSKVARTRRRGKTLLAALDDGRGWLVLHFGMDGSLRSYKDEPADRYERLRLDLDDGTHLAYESRRMLGEANVTDDADRWIEEHDLGPDALDLDESRIEELLRGRRGSVKGALTNQQLMAGIGNVYADEILFQARIHPLAKVEALDDRSLRKLSKAVRKVLEQSIRHQALPSRMPRGWLLRRREEGRPCPRCSTPFERVKVSGRSTILCPSCQDSSK